VSGYAAGRRSRKNNEPTSGGTVIESDIDDTGDIDDIKRYQRRLNIAIEATRGLFWEADFATGQLHYDRSALPRIGLEDDPVLYTRAGWLSRIHPDDQAYTETGRRDRYQQDQAFRLEYRVRNNAGVYQWIQSTGQIVERADDGSALLAVGIVININARKAAEAALLESEALHRSIVQDQTEFIARYRPDGTLIYVNDVFAKFLGKGTNELIGSRWHGFAAPQEIEMVEESLRQLTPESPVVTIEGQIYAGDGKPHWTQFDHRARFDAAGRLIEFQGVGRDITARKNDETALQISERRLNIAIEATRGIFWECDFLTGHLHFDRSALARLGLDDDPVFYTREGWRSRVHPDDRAKTQSARDASYLQDQAFRFEYRVRNNAGEYQWIQQTGQIVERAKDGSPLVSVGLTVNINACKAAEAALLESEMLHRSIVQTQTEFIVRYRPDGTLIYVNEVFAKFMGKRTDELINSNWRNFTDPSVAQKVENLLGELTPERPVVTIEDQVHAGDGALHWTQFDHFAQFDAAGQLIEFQGVGRDVTARKNAEQALQASERRLKTIIETEPECVKVIGSNGALLEMNPAGLAMLEADSLDDLKSHSLVELIAPEDRAAFIALHQRVMNGESGTLEFEVIGLRGTRRLLSTHAAPMRNPDGQGIVLLGITRDVTERRQAAIALQESEKRFRTLFESVHVIIYLNDVIYDSMGKAVDLRLLDANVEFYKTVGMTPADCIGKSMRQLFKNINELVMEKRINVALTGGSETFDYFSGNTSRWYTVRLYSPQPGQVASLLTDITERKMANERIEHLAYWDALTNLPNRALLRDRVEQSIAGAHREGGELALLFLDLDHFKNINDSLGHAAGDEILKELASRLMSPLREMDTVGRLGGDEFLIVLPGASADAAAHVAQKLLMESRQPFFLESRALTVTPSIGIALYPKDGLTFDELLKAADTAMYRAKGGGRNAYRFYTQDMNQAVFQRMVLESNLHRALKENEFQLHYQAKFDQDGQRIVGAEALIRWHQEDVGMISPAQFIPVAEESGLILSIGQWVLKETCRQIRAWINRGLPPVRVAVNVSARQFAARNIVEDVRYALQVEALRGDVLEIEITESLLAQDLEYTLEALQRLKALGVTIAIDDFGTGYSSLSYLKRFPIDRLKIDQSFVRDLETDKDDRAIATAVITLGHSLGMRVIAEGVETAQQLEILRALGCDEMQGYFLSRPVPAEDMEALLERPLTVT
jgi:diguanylate cyclase (GGDEF)-like protein/PAS domain S-box-containing protein